VGTGKSFLTPPRLRGQPTLTDLGDDRAAPRRSGDGGEGERLRLGDECDPSRISSQGGSGDVRRGVVFKFPHENLNIRHSLGDAGIRRGV
jgi:hypothetical protein